jgi:CheY-like chemotaxis protein
MQKTEWDSRSGKTVLYIDDDPDDQFLLKRALEEACPEVTVISLYNSEDAITLISKQKPDFLFLDLDMPRKSGLKCIMELREDDQFIKLPIIVYSSSSRNSNIQAAYELGANLFIIKPASHKELTGMICAVFDMDWSDPGAITKQFHNNYNYRPLKLS